MVNRRRVHARLPGCCARQRLGFPRPHAPGFVFAPCFIASHDCHRSKHAPRLAANTRTCRASPSAGVHIADVTNFVHPGTAMDEEASERWGLVPAVARPPAPPSLRPCCLPRPSQGCLPCTLARLAALVLCVRQPPSRCLGCPLTRCRATTVYLVQRRIDMLPKPLTEDICSLRFVPQGGKQAAGSRCCRTSHAAGTGSRDRPTPWGR